MGRRRRPRPARRPGPTRRRARPDSGSDCCPGNAPNRRSRGGSGSPSESTRPGRVHPGGRAGGGCRSEPVGGERARGRPHDTVLAPGFSSTSAPRSADFRKRPAASGPDARVASAATRLWPLRWSGPQAPGDVSIAPGAAAQSRAAGGARSRWPRSFCAASDREERPPRGGTRRLQIGRQGSGRAPLPVSGVEVPCGRETFAEMKMFCIHVMSWLWCCTRVVQNASTRDNWSIEK
ncbi:uncharacterized protein LOC111824440 [Myotis lucifugus]|uniref:uncharacterized protein LOC111824440 n=1 Tax=Myotis lucifugus TaxID=59463 RepID=UPI000CCC18E7|nr:uncharacterized protein LOC111824440 [Myotis lucifugus]